MPEEITTFHLEVLDALGKDFLGLYDLMYKFDVRNIDIREFLNVLNTLEKGGYISWEFSQPTPSLRYRATGRRPTLPRTIDDEWDW